MKDTPLLHTDRLVLRGFSLDDVPAVYSWCSDLEVTRFLFWYPHRDIGVSERLVKQWIRKKRNYSWALDDGSGAIGELQVIKDLPNQGFSLGYILKREKWHQGYMKEALYAVLHYLFAEADYAYSEEVTDERNAASRKLLEAVGYHFVCLQENVFISKKNEMITEAVYHLDKAEFLALENH
jgi:[ribosomal protein S5]-alanine N-acetyltransferase